MATYDRTIGTASAHSAADARTGRRLHIDWSAIFAGSALGWGALFLFSVLGAAIGFAAIDPYAIHNGDTGTTASGIWGAAAMILSSFLGAYVVVRVAGDRRRGEGLLHGAISWGLSMIAGGLLALFAAGAAANAAGPSAARELRARTVHTSSGAVVTSTSRDRARVEDASENAAKLAGLAGGGAILALVASLLGALVAASRQSGVPLVREFQLPRFSHNQRTGEPLQQSSSSVLLTDRDPALDERARRDKTTIIPPGH